MSASLPGTIRIRLTRIPTFRDTEYLSARYLRVDGIYDVPLALANELVELDYASLHVGDGPVTDIDPLDLDNDNDGK